MSAWANQNIRRVRHGFRLNFKAPLLIKTGAVATGTPLAVQLVATFQLFVPGRFQILFCALAVRSSPRRIACGVFMGEGLAKPEGAQNIRKRYLRASFFSGGATPASGTFQRSSWQLDNGDHRCFAQAVQSLETKAGINVHARQGPPCPAVNFLHPMETAQIALANPEQSMIDIVVFLRHPLSPAAS